MAKLCYGNYREESSSREVKVTLEKVEITFHELPCRENQDLKPKIHKRLCYVMDSPRTPITFIKHVSSLSLHLSIHFNHNQEVEECNKALISMLRGCNQQQKKGKETIQLVLVYERSKQQQMTTTATLGHDHNCMYGPWRKEPSFTTVTHIMSLSMIYFTRVNNMVNNPHCLIMAMVTVTDCSIMIVVFWDGLWLQYSRLLQMKNILNTTQSKLP